LICPTVPRYYGIVLHSFARMGVASMVPIKFVSLISTIYNKLVDCDISDNCYIGQYSKPVCVKLPSSSFLEA
jgi:hypothetical protein